MLSTCNSQRIHDVGMSFPPERCIGFPEFINIIHRGRAAAMPPNLSILGSERTIFNFLKLLPNGAKCNIRARYRYTKTLVLVLVVNTLTFCSLIKAQFLLYHSYRRPSLQKCLTLMTGTKCCVGAGNISEHCRIK